MRRELVPLALDAYPEAYEEFKRTMLVFVFGPEAHGSTVGELWAASTRAAIAAQLARTLRQAAGAAPTSASNRRRPSVVSLTCTLHLVWRPQHRLERRRAVHVWRII